MDRYRAGIAWSDLPHYFGTWQTAWKRHRCHGADGTWDLGWTVSVNATINRAHKPRDEHDEA